MFYRNRLSIHTKSDGIRHLLQWHKTERGWRGKEKLFSKLFPLLRRFFERLKHVVAESLEFRGEHVVYLSELVTAKDCGRIKRIGHDAFLGMGQGYGSLDTRMLQQA